MGRGDDQRAGGADAFEYDAGEPGASRAKNYGFANFSHGSLELILRPQVHRSFAANRGNRGVFAMAGVDQWFDVDDPAADSNVGYSTDRKRLRGQNLRRPANFQSAAAFGAV